LIFYSEIDYATVTGMKSTPATAVAKDPWECNGKPIPEVFPTKMAFVKTVLLGIGMTATIFGLLSLLIIKPWH